MTYRIVGCALAALLLAGCSDDSDGAPCPKPTASVQAAYAACIATTVQADCENAGGTWTTFNNCSCPTGQEGCRCSSPDDCLGGCIHEMPGQPDPPTSCSGVTQGLCRGFGPEAGCGCWFEPTPQFYCYQ